MKVARTNTQELADIERLAEDLDAVSILLDKERSENERLRAALERLVSDLTLDADSGLIPPDQRLRFARYVRDARAALAAKER